MTLPEFFELLERIAEMPAVVPALIAAVTVVSLVGTAAGLARKRQVRASSELDQRLEHLERMLTVYAESATSVARTLDQLLLNRAPVDRHVHSSRRYLLQQARARLADGEPLDGVAHGLALSRDEVQLLARLGPADILVGEPAVATERASEAA